MTQQKNYIVGVTGSGPFFEEKVNTSSLVKDAIPESISLGPGGPNITVVKYAHDFKNLLSDMERFTDLWSRRKSVFIPDSPTNETLYIDAMLHIGMRPGDEGWSFESKAHRDGYEFEGEDGVPLPHQSGSKGGMFEGLPSILKPMFDMPTIEKHVADKLLDIPTRLSTDAGMLFCEFGYYCSLAALYRRGEPARAIYLHVPKKPNDVDIARGAKVGTELINEMVQSLNG